MRKKEEYDARRLEGQYRLGNLEYVTRDGEIINIRDVYEKSKEYLESQNQYSRKFGFDGPNGNVHLRPNDERFAKKCSDSINNLMEDIMREWSYQKKICYQPEQFSNIPQKYVDVRHLFEYVYVKEGEYSYQLTGIRFYVEQIGEKKYVNEKLCELQFIRFKKGIRSIEYYPENDANGTYGKENVYYNPRCSFYDNTEVIISEFVKFIESYENKNMNKESYEKTND